MRKIAILTAVLSTLILILWPSRPAPRMEFTLQRLQPQGTHVVRRGEWIKKIAPTYNVPWEGILLANETDLQARYEATCRAYPASYTNNPNRHGYFCNDQYNRPYGNTLRPGWPLVIPAQAPPDILKVVGQCGKRVALVIDDTRSMSTMRLTPAEVGELYASAIYLTNRDLAGIYLYADGKVRKYTDAGSVQYVQSGKDENTHGALLEAAKSNADTLILITDEEGNDWDWPLVFGMGLPPVISHCLPDLEGDYRCEANLTKLARKTAGIYVRTH